MRTRWEIDGPGQRSAWSAEEAPKAGAASWSSPLEEEAQRQFELKKDWEMEERYFADEINLIN